MGYLLLPLTLLADVLGGALSYLYGTYLLPWLWAALAQSIGPGLLYLITWPFAAWVHRVPPSWPPTFTALPLLGQLWLGLFLAAHVYDAIRHLARRYDPTPLGVPHAGNPGEDKWELVQRRWRDFAEALSRFSQHEQLHLRHPADFRYTTEDAVPVVELRGRQLRIRENALHQSQVPALAPELARVLGMYNSLDWLFADVLDYYPPRVMRWHLALGIGIWLPTVVKVTAWPLWHWRRRALVYDKLAWLCGQGQQLYDRLAGLPSYQRPFFSPLPLKQTRLGQLEALIRTEHQWMQEHHLIAEGVEPPILHGRAMPRQLGEGRSRPNA